MIDLYMVLTAFNAALWNNIFAKALMLAICADMVFGSLRAVKHRCWNSSIGIDGGIRKVGMVSAVFLLTLMDMILDVNLIGFLDAEVLHALDAIGVVKLGITELFALLFICYESVSVLKNMLLCGIPIPIGIRSRLEAWLIKMTDETEALKEG